MMSFEEFTENVLKEIRVKAGGAFQVRKHDVTKNNRMQQTGIAVIKEGADIGPCLYLNELYREYESGGRKFDETVDEAYRLILKSMDDDMPDVDLSGFTKWETVHGNIYAKLINAEQNREQLGVIPHRMFLDLAVVYYAAVRDHAGEEVGTILISREHMAQWGQKEETLYQTAMRNMRSDGEADFACIETVVRRILPDIVVSDEEEQKSPDINMYILTNNRRRFGAAEILDKKTLRKIADQVGDGFVVLPSSVHETIVLPPKEDVEYGKLADMVRMVNETEVDIEERLSYHVYVYSRDEEALKIVA